MFIAGALGALGRRFESCRPDKSSQLIWEIGSVCRLIFADNMPTALKWKYALSTMFLLI